MIFCKNLDDFEIIDEELKSRLPKCGDPDDPTPCPWVLNYSKPGEITAESIRTRNDIKLFITTSVMQMGIDEKDIDIIIMLRPFNNLHDILQCIGRGGRMNLDGTRRQVIFFNLFNAADIATNVPGMTKEVRDFCNNGKNECLKSIVNKFFCVKATLNNSFPTLCCSSCQNLMRD